MMRIAPDSLRAKDPYPDAHMFMALWSLYGGIDGDEAFVPPMHLDEVHNSMVESGYKTPEGRQTDLGRAVWDSIPVRFAGGVETVSGHTLYVAVIRGADLDLLDRIGSDCILGENTGGLSVSGARDAEEAAAVGFAMGSGTKARPSSLFTRVSIWSVVAASVSGRSTASWSRKNCR